MEPLRLQNLQQTQRIHKPSEQSSIPVKDEEPGGQDQFTGSEPEEDELTLEEELEEGERHCQELTERYGLWEDEEQYERLVLAAELLLPRMQREQIEYDFQMLDTDLAFASSCSNGQVFFTRGLMLELEPDDWVLFFAAHELAHTELRHFATRRSRLSYLRSSMTSPPGSSGRQKLEAAAVLVVRHQEEFEADHAAAAHLEELGFPESSAEALSELEAIYHELSPEALQRPTHPSFPERVQRLLDGAPPPDPIKRMYSMV